jgi:hypothetical protein
MCTLLFVSHMRINYNLNAQQENRQDLGVDNSFFNKIELYYFVLLNKKSNIF